MLAFLANISELIFFVAFVSSGKSFPEPLASDEERAALEALAKGDEEARDKLIRHNLRLVAHVAKKYSNSGYDQEDLISIGIIGLIKGISTFDPGKGANLATYAARCIQNEILMAMRSAKKHRGEVSLNNPIGSDKEGNEMTVLDVMGTLPTLVSDEVELQMQVVRLRELVKACLAPREQLVIELRYGLRNGQCLPQREVAQILEISRSYVSRIEKKALQKLNKAFDQKNLKEQRKLKTEKMGG